MSGYNTTFGEFARRTIHLLVCSPLSFLYVCLSFALLLSVSAFADLASAELSDEALAKEGFESIRIASYNLNNYLLRTVAEKRGLTSMRKSASIQRSTALYCLRNCLTMSI